MFHRQYLSKSDAPVSTHEQHQAPGTGTLKWDVMGSHTWCAIKAVLVCLLCVIPLQATLQSTFTPAHPFYPVSDLINVNSVAIDACSARYLKEYSCCSPCPSLSMHTYEIVGSHPTNYILLQFLRLVVLLKCY